MEGKIGEIVQYYKFLSINPDTKARV